MILDMYINPELTNATANAGLFMLAGLPLLFVTAGTIDKYRATQKKEKKKRKKLKIMSIVFGIMSLICIGGFVYNYFYAAPKARDAHPNTRWSDYINGGNTRSGHRTRP